MTMGTPREPPMERHPETGRPYHADQPWGRGLVVILAFVMVVVIVSDVIDHHWRAVAIEVPILAAFVLLVLGVRRLIRRLRR